MTPFDGFAGAERTLTRAKADSTERLQQVRQPLSARIQAFP